MLCFLFLTFGRRIQIHVLKHQGAQIPQSLFYFRRHRNLVLALTVFYNVMDKGIQPFSCGFSQKHTQSDGNIIFRNQTCPLGIVHIVVNVGNFIAVPYHLSLQSVRTSAGPMVPNPISDFPGEIQSLSSLFQPLHHTDALFEMGKSQGTYLV